uniref:TNFR-Cys domain-containing protein n=1 Tax=Anabas testudineus TaxID=64144 RepID=A0A7N6B1L2_ANATE
VLLPLERLSSLKVLKHGETTTCNLAEYQIGNECCPMCLRGSRVRTDCTEFRSTSCLPCLEGTYMNQPSGLKQCFPCSQCDAGSGLKIKCSCTTTSDTVCEPLEGFYCVDPSDNGCRAAQKHRSCEPGQYISQKAKILTNCAQSQHSFILYFVKLQITPDLTASSSSFLCVTSNIEFISILRISQSLVFTFLQF